MVQPRSLAAALTVALSVLSLSSAEPDFESEVNPMIRRGGEKTSSRVSQALASEKEVDPRTMDPLEVEHDVHRKLQSSCSGNMMMCGCEDDRQQSYRGHFTVSQNGYQCREWRMASKYPNQGLEDGPYCRNPNGAASRAWCFVEGANVVWDYCHVPMCAADSSPADRSDSDITAGCMNTARYDAIYADIEAIKNSIGNDVDRSHFLGGIVRMVAHDFMDFDASNNRKPFGSDGCMIFDSPMNVGLSSIWCDTCLLKQLYDSKYSDLSRADFWVASANAVIYLTSVNNSLDLRNTYYWGRTTLDSCPGADTRLPTTGGCQDVEGVFLERMGLTWKDAVALLGAHTLGRGNKDVRRLSIYS